MYRILLKGSVQNPNKTHPIDSREPVFERYIEIVADKYKLSKYKDTYKFYNNDELVGRVMLNEVVAILSL